MFLWAIEESLAEDTIIIHQGIVSQVIDSVLVGLAVEQGDVLVWGETEVLELTADPLPDPLVEILADQDNHLLLCSFR